MKVKLSYSIDITEVKEKISELLQKSAISLEHQSRLTHQVSELLPMEEVNEQAGLALLDSIRRSLSEVDQNLVETAAILYGYMEALKDKEAPSPEEQVHEMEQMDPPPPDRSPPPIPEE